MNSRLFFASHAQGLYFLDRLLVVVNFRFTCRRQTICLVGYVAYLRKECRSTGHDEGILISGVRIYN